MEKLREDRYQSLHEVPMSHISLGAYWVGGEGVLQPLKWHWPSAKWLTFLLPKWRKCSQGKEKVSSCTLLYPLVLTG